MKAVKGEGRGCGDVARMCAVAEALARLVGCGAPLRAGALSGVLTLLVSRLPRVMTTESNALALPLGPCTPPFLGRF